MSATSSSATGIMSASAAPAKSAKRVAKKTEDAPAPVATPVVAAPAPVAAKATKAKAPKAEVAAAPAVVAPAVTPAAPATDAAKAPVAEVTEDLRAEVQAVTARLLAVRESLSELITESKKLEKRAAKLQKLADKRKRKSRARAEGEEGKPATESVFTKPVAISAALCKFMGRAEGSTESRCNVTKFITDYVREHSLKAERHGINPDAKLRALLAIKDGEKLTYFNLQRYLNVHYIKTVKPVA